MSVTTPTKSILKKRLASERNSAADLRSMRYLKRSVKNVPNLTGCLAEDALDRVHHLAFE